MTRPNPYILALLGILLNAAPLVRGSEPADASAERALPAKPAKPLSASELDFFERRVRPVLAERCYSCHSKQAKKLRGHLLLDSRDGWLKGGDSGPAIVPGDPDHSPLVEAIRYTNEDTQMPPKAKLPAGEIDALVQWVRMGAPDPRTDAAPSAPAAPARGIDLAAGRQHWAYQPIRRPPVPAVHDSAWPRNDIDRFILARLESKGLRPAADADSTALVRRLYFDLVGLPPTPGQMDAFIEDPSPDRYERLVDQLLASPQFGQRWGRHWLDVARFGESLTLRGFVLKDAWRYRDYVIDVFNQDRPFDRFMEEQVAGDLLPADSLEQSRRQLVATTFLAMGNNNLEEQDKKQLEMDVVDEQINAIGTAFLAQTIGCARCHDHKFDPIPTRDYYALAGILHSTQALEHANVSKWLEIPLPSDPAREEVLGRHEAAVAALQKKLEEARRALATATRGARSPGKVIAVADLPGVVVDDVLAKQAGSWKQSKSVRPYIGEGYLTDDGNHAEPGTLTFQPELPETGKYEVRFAYTPAANRATNVQVTVFGADGDQAVTVNEQEAPPLDGHFISLGTHAFEKNGQGFVVVSNQGADGVVIADAVQFLPAGSKAATASPASHATASASATQKTAATSPTIDGGEAPSSRESVKKLEAELKRLVEAGPHRDTVMSVRESKVIGDARVHLRGSVHTLGEPAPRGFLQVIALDRPVTIPAGQSGRRQLAEWLADPQNPLPARVMANRAWYWLTGAGLVRTTDNFGTTGEAPSNPELLDYLAARFSGQDPSAPSAGSGQAGSGQGERWSVKSLVRQIVLSRTYQLSSEAAGDVEAKNGSADPEDRLQWRMNRRRLDAECIRDAVLSVTGRLSPETGGPSYPPGLASDFAYHGPDAGADARRSLYLPVFRNALPPLFEAFDFADPSVSTGRRNVSTVAPQALFMLNNPWLIEQAGRAADCLLSDKDCPDDRARVILAYRRTLGRAPTETEQRLAAGFLAEGRGGAAGAGLADRQEAWSQLFHALFASVEFRYER